MSKERFATVTVVSNGKGVFSIHTSFKQACKDYGWPYKGRFKQEINGFTVTRYPFNVTIDCLELLEFLSRKMVVQTKDILHGEYLIEVSGYSSAYLIVANYEERHDEAEYLDGDRGSEMIRPAIDYHELTEVIQVNKLDDDDTEIKIDAYTKRELLNILYLD